ncbi:MAG: SufS family cysteine desulfurase [Actinobacteria bacterium]|nr:SufS family cysteine desulfurase [Actinomycetota bacterium]
MDHFDAQTVKKDFPTLRREVHDGRRLVYLDSAASSQTPQSVIDAMDDYYEQHRSNVHRGVYQLATEATDLYERGRTRVAEFVDAPVEGTVFTKNCTEAINLVAYSYVRRRLGPDDVLLTTQMEHHANLVPWQQAAADAGFEIRYLPVTPDGYLDLEAFPRYIADGKVAFFAVSQMSNVLATVNPVAEMVAQVKDANPSCKVLVDGAQSVPHMPVSFRQLGADFLAFSGHKMCGPTGIGVLAADPELLEEMPPFLTGGEMILDVTLDGATWNEIPHKFEAGTMMIAEGAGLAAAVDYLDDLGMDAVRAHEVELTRAALDALGEVDGVTVHGPTVAEDRGGAISFAIDGLHPHDIGTILDREGVCVRVGHHCAKPLLRCLGVNSTARASFYLYNDEDDIAPLIDGIRTAQRFFGTVPSTPPSTPPEEVRPTTAAGGPA